MRSRSNSDLSFRGFVVLADIVFAVSTSMLLLHEPPKPAPPPVRPCQDCDALEERLKELLRTIQDKAVSIDSLAGQLR